MRNNYCATISRVSDYDSMYRIVSELRSREFEWDALAAGFEEKRAIGSNHVHLLISTNLTKRKLTATLRSVLKLTTKDACVFVEPVKTTFRETARYVTKEKNYILSTPQVTTKFRYCKFPDGDYIHTSVQPEGFNEFAFSERYFKA